MKKKMTDCAFKMWACRKLADFAAAKDIGILGLASRAAAAKAEKAASAAASPPAPPQSKPEGGDGYAVVLAQASSLAAKVATKYAAAVARGSALELDAAKVIYYIYRYTHVVRILRVTKSLTRPPFFYLDRLSIKDGRGSVLSNRAKV